MKKNCIFFLMIFSIFSLKAEGLNQEFDLAEAEEAEESSSVMPKYGNWCGLNHPSNPEKAEEPIDTLDAICKRHDLCYLDKGHMSCECDGEFNRDVVTNLSRFTGPEKILAHTFRIYFRGSPCYGNQKDKIAPTRVLSSIAKKADIRTKEIIRELETISR
ncbi:MAG: hypothetical protein ABW104_03755 [Candidatus Thiodiazotropha sp. 6PLUC2]